MADAKTPAKNAPARRARKPAPKAKPQTTMGLMYCGPNCPRWGLVSRRLYPSKMVGDLLVPILPIEAGDLLERHKVRALFVHPEQLSAAARDGSVVAALVPKLAKIYAEECP